MVSVCLPSDALLQHLPSYSGFSYLGSGVSLHGYSSKAQPPLLSLDKAYPLTAALPDLHRGTAPLGPPAPARAATILGWSSRLPPLASGMGLLLPAAAPDLRCWVTPLVTAPDLGHGVAPLGHRPSGMGSSRLLPLTSDVG